jgi:hypothetical protein
MINAIPFTSILYPLFHELKQKKAKIHGVIQLKHRSLRFRRDVFSALNTYKLSHQRSKQPGPSCTLLTDSLFTVVQHE